MAYKIVLDAGHGGEDPGAVYKDRKENNMKKRILTAVLAAALVTGTCAATVSAKEEKTYTIGICQLVQHDALDAGHGGEDPGAVYKDRKEKDDNLKLTLAVGKILEENGVDVVYTRTTDIYQTPFEKAKAANEAGADFFISFHRNSSSKPEQYNGVEVLVYDKKGIKYQMAQNILGALGELGFRELGVKERPGLVVLRRTKMPALLVETGFINSEKDNQLFEKKFEEIARSIADAILGTLNEETVEEPLYYRVQTGAFRNRENADRMLYQLTDQGFPAFILRENDLYKVQVGAYMQLGNAVNMEQRLRDSGYSTVIVTK